MPAKNIAPPEMEPMVNCMLSIANKAVGVAYASRMAEKALIPVPTNMNNAINLPHLVIWRPFRIANTMKTINSNAKPVVSVEAVSPKYSSISIQSPP